MKILVTGGAGFIGSALVRHIIENTHDTVINVDKLTYAGNLRSLEAISFSPRYKFVQLDILDSGAIASLLDREKPDAIMHLAAESHVDRSIDGPADFIHTNIVGTYTLLETSLRYWRSLGDEKKAAFRFHHISTDEVFGSLGETGFFTEQTPYKPNSPYSASKAASDHLVRAWHHTYGFPAVITNCSNNYGPYQFPEKLIPLMVLRAMEEKNLPVYGNGQNIRDWLYVDDHVHGLLAVVRRGRIGETYNLGGGSECRNIDIVEMICATLDQLRPRSGGKLYKELITFVADRPGHDFRYAIDASKVERELGWSPRYKIDAGLRATVQWYLDNRAWWENVLSGQYRAERLGGQA